MLIHRDSLLATLLDAVRTCNSPNVHVRMTRTPRGKRVVPLYANVDEETEANLLRLVIHNYQYPGKRFEILERFNANIPHSGLNYSVTQEVRHTHFNPKKKTIELHKGIFAISHRAYLLKTRRNLYWVRCKL